MEEEQEAQFGAVTFFPEGCEPVVAFRGTDDSVVGWKEDFRLAFRKPLASQEMSSVYLNQVGCKLPGAFMVCGHSKGGNLAAYAATWAETGVQRRITDIYSLDGPGFLPEVFEGDSYEQIRSRVHRILPYSSLVGMLLQNYEQYEVVKIHWFSASFIRFCFASISTALTNFPSSICQVNASCCKMPIPELFTTSYCS